MNNTLTSLTIVSLHSQHRPTQLQPTACTQPDNGQIPIPILGNGRTVVVCGSPGETSDDPLLGVIDGFSPKSWAVESKK